MSDQDDEKKTATHGASGSSGSGEAYDSKTAMAVITDSPYSPPTTSNTSPSSAPLINAKSVDEGAALMLEYESELQNVTEDEYNKLRRKIDWRLLPLMLAMYMIQFCDKTSLGNAAILGIKTDNHLTQDRFNQCSSFFYIGYLVAEYPVNILLQRFRTGRVLTFAVFSWALLMLAHLGSNSFAGLLTLRILLGVVESCVTPGFLALTSSYYKFDEQASRVGYWFLMNGAAIILNALVAYGVQGVHLGDWMPWRVFFLILGLMTTVLFVLYLFFMPDTPATAWFLSPRERAMAIKRVSSANRTGTKNKHFKRDQFVEALRDPKIYLFALYAILSNIPNSLTVQRSIIINQLGFDTLQSALLNIPTGVLEIICIPAATYLARKWKNHTADVMALWTLPSLVGASMLIGLGQDHKVARLVGVFLAPLNTSGFVLSLAWCSASNSGSTKKSVANAIQLIAYCVGNLAGPYIWRAEYAPQNIVPWAIVLVSYFCCIPTGYALKWIMSSENKRRDALAADGAGVASKEEHDVKVRLGGSEGEGGEGEKAAAAQSPDEVGQPAVKLDTALLDLTDKQDLHFRYPL